MLEMFAAHNLAQSMRFSLAPPIAQANQFRLGTDCVRQHPQAVVILRMIPLNPGDIFIKSLWDFGIDQIIVRVVERSSKRL